MSYYGEAARVERCPPHTAPHRGDCSAARKRRNACTIATSMYRPCSTHGTHTEHLWTRCHVTDELEVFFHSSTPSVFLTRKGIKRKSKTPNFYRIVCGNLKELCSLNKQFTIPLTSSTVLSSDFSSHSFVERPHAHKQEGSKSIPAKTTAAGGGGALSADAFPTISLLLTVGPFSELFLIVLLPCEIPMKKGESVLSYRAIMRRASASARITLVSPCGDCVYTLCPSFERPGDPADDDATTHTVICGGSYLSLASARPSKLLQPLLLSVPLRDVTANSSRRTHDMVGTPFTYGACLAVLEEEKTDHLLRQGGPMQQHEIVLFSASGWAFNFRLSDVKHAKKTDTANFVCHHPFTYAHKTHRSEGTAVDGVNALCATIWNFQQRWNVSMWYSDACARERHPPFGLYQGCADSHRASQVLACSTTGRLILTCSRSNPSVGCITNVPSSHSKASRHAMVYFPRDVVIHDAVFVEEEKNVGFLLLCRSANHASLPAGPAQCPEPWLRDTEASSIQLWFVSLGGGACEQVHFSSFRNWNACPSSFLYSSFSLLQFASVCLREDSALHDVWEIKVRSSTCDDVLLVALAALPTVSTWLQQKANEEDAAAALPRLIRYLVFFYVCNAAPLRSCDAAAIASWAAQWAGGGAYCISPPAETGAVTSTTSSESKALALEVLLKKCESNSEYSPPHVYLRMIATFLQNTFLYNSESESFDEVLCACIVNVFRAVTEGWRSFFGACTWEPTRWRHVLFLHHCVSLLKDLLDLLQSNDSVSAVTACLSHVSHFLKEDVQHALDVRHVLCARLFDHMYPSVVQLPSFSTDVLNYASPSLAKVLATAKQWLEEEEKTRVLTVGDMKVSLQTVNSYGAVVKPLNEVLECVKGGPTRMAAVNVADVYWAARRLFLQQSPQAAVSLLQQISTMGQRDKSLTELLALYQNLWDRVRQIKV